MGGQVDEFAKELKALRRGYGIGTIDLKAHTGSRLRAAAGVAAADAADQVRRKVQALIEELISQLPEEARPLSRMAFGLAGGGEPGRPRYLARVGQFARQQGVDSRTIQRQIDVVIEQMAELLVSQVRHRERRAARQPPWRTTDLKVFLSFDLTVPEVFEIRQVMALREGLTELDVGMTLTPPPGWNGEGSLEDLGVDLLYGGQFTGRAMRSSNRIAFRLCLPATLGRSERHEYALRVKLPTERGIAPHYVCTPDYECESFELSIRFRTDSPPVRVWRLPGVLPLELDDAKASRTPITPNAFGEVHETFTDLEPHLSYGVGWEPP
jgi:hypothetical protein